MTAPSGVRERDTAWLGLATGVAFALVRSRRGPGGPLAPGASVAPRAGADHGRVSYDQAVQALRELVAANVPDRAEVLVISRGDPALVDLAGRRSRHFPADLTGTWAGHHPALGAAAAMLVEQRGDADHLVVPAASSWWFDTYPELVELLAGGRCVAEVPSVGSIWELPPRAGRPTPAPAAGGSELGPYRSATAHAADVVAALVPAGDEVLVISRGDPERVALGNSVGRHFPSSRDGTYLGHPADDRHALAMLADAAAAGAGWLLVHDDVSWWADAYPGLWQHLHDGHRLVVERPAVCRLFRLTPTTDAES